MCPRGVKVQILSSAPTKLLSKLPPIEVDQDTVLDNKERSPIVASILVGYTEYRQLR